MSNNEIQSEAKLEANVQPSINGLKESMWKVKMALKIYAFLWRALSNAILIS